ALFFFQAEDGIRAFHVTGVQTCALPISRAGLRVLSLARLAPEKNIDQLMQAFAHVAHEHPEARLTIAGRGPEEGALRILAYSLRSEERRVGEAFRPRGP